MDLPWVCVVIYTMVIPTQKRLDFLALHFNNKFLLDFMKNAGKESAKIYMYVHLPSITEASFLEAIASNLLKYLMTPHKVRSSCLHDDANVIN